MSVFGLADVALDREETAASSGGARHGIPRSPANRQVVTQGVLPTGARDAATGQTTPPADTATQPAPDGTAKPTKATTPAQQAADVLSTFVLWLPGEVVAGYAAVVAMTQLPQPAAPVVDSLPWWIALAATPLLLLLVAHAKKGKRSLTKSETRVLTVRVLLSMPAFVLWSASVPFSVWTMWADTSSPLFWFVMLLAAGAFTAIAEWAAAAAKRRRRPRRVGVTKE